MCEVEYFETILAEIDWLLGSILNDMAFLFILYILPPIYTPTCLSCQDLARPFTAFKNICFNNQTTTYTPPDYVSKISGRGSH